MRTFDRPDALYFVGPRMPNGEPAEHLAGYGIAARDMEKGDPAYDRLTDDQVKFALDSGLYQRSKPTGAKAEAIAEATEKATAPATPPAAPAKEG